MGIKYRNPREQIGLEMQVKLTGEPATRYHGTLTSQLDGFLESAGDDRQTYADLERALKKVFRERIALKVSSAARDQGILLDNAVTRAGGLLASLDQLSARRIITKLEQVIAQREQQGDYFPEGRLNLGIAYACLGEYESALRWLDDAVNMFRYPSDIGRSEQMAA